MKKLIFTPDEILRKKNPNAITCIYAEIYKDAPLRKKKEAFDILKNELGSPDITISNKNKTIIVWLVPYSKYDDFFNRIKYSKLAEMHNKNIGIYVYGGIPDEVEKILKKRGYIIVSSILRYRITRKDKKEIKENANAFSQILNKLRNKGLIKYYRITRQAIVIKKPNGKWGSFISAWKTPKGYKINGKYFRNLKDVKEYLIWYFDLKQKEE